MTTNLSADEPAADDPATAHSHFLSVALAKGLIDQDLARTVADQAQTSGRTPATILLERGILTPHIVAAIERDVARALGPRIIGGYRIVDELGRGGMGVVYRALQLSVGREVALKLMRESSVQAGSSAASSAGSDSYAERFLHEARTAASVNHPHVVTLFDAGRDGDDLYLVMELVVGGDAARLRAAHGGRLPPRLAVGIVRDAAKGLAAIHRVGLIHRDIKPANIFLSEDGGAKLADLGLSRQADGDHHLTITGAILGTPAYMSPEQAEGLAIDIRSDIYALGATLYALVTGQDPYQGATAMAVAAKAIAGPFPDARVLVPDLPATVAVIIGRCTAHHRDDRYFHPLDLITACDDALALLPATPSVRVAVRMPVPASASAPTLTPQTASPAPAPAPTPPTALSSSARPGVAVSLPSAPATATPAQAAPAAANAPRVIPAAPSRAAAGGWGTPIAIIIIAALAVGGGVWWWVDALDRDQDRDVLLAAISALPDHATPDDEAAVAATVATYDSSADDQRRATVDAAWTARRAAIDHLREAARDALLAKIAATSRDASAAEELGVDQQVTAFHRYADATAMSAVSAAWSQRKTDIRNAKSTAVISAVNALPDDADDARLDRLQAQITALVQDGVPSGPMQAALDHRRTDIVGARAAAADRAAATAKAKADADASVAAETARQAAAAATLAQRRQTIGDGLAILDQTLTDARTAMQQAAQFAARYAAADTADATDDLHDYRAQRRAVWARYVALLAHDGDLATVTAADTTVRDRRDADPDAAEAAIASALPVAKRWPDHAAALRHKADDDLAGWCWDLALAGKSAALAAAAADLPALAGLLAPRITALRRHLAVLDAPGAVPDDAATAIALLAQRVPGDADAGRWQAKLDEIGRLRVQLAPLDQPGLPSADQRQAAARLTALVGPDDAQANRCQGRLDRLDGLASQLARLESWPPLSVDDLAPLRGAETAWETLTGDAGATPAAIHRALLVEPIIAADQVAALTASAATPTSTSATAPAADRAGTLRILRHGDVWRLARYDANGSLLVWYHLAVHAIGDGWHLLPAVDPGIGGALAADYPPANVLLPGRPGPGALLWRANRPDLPVVVTVLVTARLPPFQAGARTIAALVAAPTTRTGRPADGRPAWAADFGNDACGPWADLAVAPSASATANAPPVIQRLRLLVPGTFIMGSPPDEAGRDRDETQHVVTFTRSLWLADSECAQSLWQAVMGTNPSRFRGDPQRPVEQVSWQDCVDFCAALGRRGDLTARLPTESEWEYAARAGSGATTVQNPPMALADSAWYSGNADAAPHAVCGKRANAWGFYDLLGNVGEWCGDWYGDYPGPASDPTGAPAPKAEAQSPDPRHTPLARKCIRGGSWLDPPQKCRPAGRSASTPDFSFAATGFRFAITVP